ncbi:hypothetical protein DFH28DRAFT_979950 [Melampsora americana]|nr:hypothetical protein DFH28DRAFT_979950 [Melampsora americana]
MPRGSNTWYASDSKAANISRNKRNDEVQLYAYKIREAKRTFEQDKEDAKLHLNTTQRREESDPTNPKKTSAQEQNELKYRKYDDYDRRLTRELEFERYLNHQLVLQNEILRLREIRHDEIFRSIDPRYHVTTRPSLARLPSVSFHNHSYYDTLLENLDSYPVCGRYLEESYPRMI